MKSNLIKYLVFSTTFLFFLIGNVFAEDTLSIDNSEVTLINKPQNNTKSDSIFGDFPRISRSDFLYADNQQFTIDGKLPYLQSHTKKWRLWTLGGVYTTAFLIQHFAQMNTIWRDQTHFRFIEDGKYALYTDKFGHFYGAYTMGYFARETFYWAGFSHKTSVWLGAATGLAYSTYVEIQDGFSKDWGFSPTDWYADLGGAVFNVAQQYVPVLQNFTPKFQYFPSPWFGARARIPSQGFFDDYSSQVFFMSINVHNLLPDGMKKFWPSWMQLSLGYTTRNLCSAGDDRCKNCNYHWDYKDADVYGDPKFLVALDYDLVKVLPSGGNFWNWIRQSLNVLKFPSPTLEISKSDTKFYLVYPFSLHIGGSRIF